MFKPDVTIEIDGDIGTIFSELEIGSYFVMRNSLFIKTADGSGEAAYSYDPTSAICLNDGEEWVVDSVEKVSVPSSIRIEVSL